MTDPPVRPDGLCVVCLKPRVRPKHGGYATRAQFDADPFCSRKCAEEYHGLKMAQDQSPTREAAA